MLTLKQTHEEYKKALTAKSREIELVRFDAQKHKAFFAQEIQELKEEMRKRRSQIGDLHSTLQKYKNDCAESEHRNSELEAQLRKAQTALTEAPLEFEEQLDKVRRQLKLEEEARNYLDKQHESSRKLMQEKEEKVREELGECR